MNKGKYCHKYWQLEDANLRYCRDKGQHLKSRSGFQSTGSSPVSGTNNRDTLVGYPCCYVLVRTRTHLNAMVR